LWLAKLVPNAKHITNPNSGHEIHKEQPQLVIASCPRRCGAQSASFTARRIAPSENGLVMSQAFT
jgi:hypothetical protein